MPGSLTDYLEAQILNQLFGGVPYNTPNILYCGYMVGTASDAGAGAEPNSGGYARVAITNNTANFPATSNQIKTNGSEILFPVATSNHGLVQSVGLFDSPSSGNLLLYFPLTAPINVSVGDAMRIPIGSMTVQFNAGGLSNYVKNALLNQIMGNVPFNIIPILYFSYATSTPTDATPGTEPSGNSYGRAAVNNTTNNFPVTTVDSKQNVVDIAFAESTGNQGTATHTQIFDASSGGNYLGRYVLPAPALINANAIPTIFANTITITLD
jgi:hypothetical protein